MPEGERFNGRVSDESIIHSAEQIGYPLVLKPTEGSFGKGVITNIRDERELESALKYVRGKLKSSEVILEKYIPGKEYRLYIVGESVVGAMNRIPANVTGDGINTIASLIEAKNEERNLNPRLVSCPIIINEEVKNYLSRHGLTINSVPEKDSKVFLTEKTNISIGGDPVDVLDEIPDDIKEAAVKALHSVPGLPHGAVDLIVHAETSKVYVIELNPTANLGGLLYPIYGKARDIPKAIVDFYFPETKKDHQQTSAIYFDYKEVLMSLEDKTAFSTTVIPFNYGRLYKKKYIIKGDVGGFSFQRWIKGKAFHYSLNGYTKKRVDQTLEVVVAGEDEQSLNSFRQILLESSEHYKIDEVLEQIHEGTVKIGFHIQGERKEFLKRYKEEEEELMNAEKKLKILEKRHMDMLNSRAWKMTLPLRKVTGFTKYIYRKTLRRTN